MGYMYKANGDVINNLRLQYSTRRARHMLLLLQEKLQNLECQNNDIQQKKAMGAAASVSQWSCGRQRLSETDGF